MAYEVKLSDEVEWGEDTCRLLELVADSEQELSALVRAAHKNKWFEWIAPSRRRDGRWGAVMEKGMPDSAHFGNALGWLALDEVAESFVS